MSAPGMDGPDDPAAALGDPLAADHNRLRSYLAARFPGEFEADLARGQSSAVTLACRLLDRLPLTPGTGVPPCVVARCNKPAGHIDPHVPS